MRNCSKGLSSCRTVFLLIPLIVTLYFPETVVAEIKVEFAMAEDPRFVPPEIVKEFPPEFKTIWLKALKHEEVDFRRQLCETIDTAHRIGVPGLKEAEATLMELLAEPDQHPALRLAAARTLITLEAKQSASLLWERAVKDGRDMAQLAEPALAKWDYKPARKVWLQRVNTPEKSRQYLKLAIDGLAVVRERQAVDGLLKLVDDSTAFPDIRLSAARAVGILQTGDLETRATELAAAKTSRRMLRRLLAANLIAHHSGPRAEELLKELALDPEPAVASMALGRLLEIDPELVAVLAPQTLDNADPGVRHLVARGLVARPSVERVQAMSGLLDDPHPDVRSYLRESFFQLAENPSFDATVRDEGMKMLATENWRGLEQAALLLAALDHKPAAPRLVELLEFKRQEVLVTAAWALRKLAVPETLPAMYDRVQRVFENRNVPNADVEGIHFQISHLFEAFGLMDFWPPEDLMRKLVPKSFSYHPYTRAAAIWALGHLHKGEDVPELSGQYRQRLADVTSMPPEFPVVRRATAISLGRMKSQSSLESLRKFSVYDGIQSPIGHACYWAVHQINGEPIPEPGVVITSRANWVLVPIK